MWIAGCISFYLFYLLVFRWYLSKSRLGPLDRPMAWAYGWYHIAVLVIAILLLAASSYFFYLTAGWLVFAPVVLLPISWVVYIRMGRDRLNELIKQSMAIQVEMERLGHPQPQINQAIMVRLFGEDVTGVGAEFNIHQFMKYCVLSRLGYYDSDSDFKRLLDEPSSVSAGQRIDALIDYWRGELKRSARL